MSESVPGPTATSDALAGTQWQLVVIDGQPVLDAVPLIVDFGHDGRVTGTTGVNQFTASYSVTAEYLTFGPVASTRRAGTPEMMQQESRVVGSLAGMCSFHLDVATLAVEGPLGRVELLSTTARPEPSQDPVTAAEVPRRPAPQGRPQPEQ